MFESLYRPYGHEVEAFGGAWCGPFQYESWKETLVAKYETALKSDGQTVEVYCTAAPARFYTLKVLPGEDSIGNPQPGYVVSTGSGAAALAAKIADAICQGMLGFKPAPVADATHKGD